MRLPILTVLCLDDIETDQVEALLGDELGVDGDFIELRDLDSYIDKDLMELFNPYSDFEWELDLVQGTHLAR